MRPKKQRIFMGVMAGIMVVLLILPMITTILVR